MGLWFSVMGLFCGLSLVIAWLHSRHQLGFIRRTVEAAGEPIVVVDSRGRVTYGNAAAGKLFGYPAVDLARKMAADLLFVQDGQDLLPQLQRCMLSEDRHARTQHELRGRARDGCEFPVRMRITEMIHRGSSSFVLVLQDVLGEHIVELELRRYANQLKHAKSSLQSQNKNLERMVIERTAQLAGAMEEAEGANRSKTDFVNIVSHELRSPLHGILSFAELGTDRAPTLDRAKLQGYFSTITQCGNSLLNLVNDLLDLSKIESGAIELNVVPFNLVNLVDQVVSESEVILKNKKLSLLMNCNLEQVWIDLDPKWIAQVVRNLMSNALKFAPDETHIEVSVVQGAKGVMVAVRDQGLGIPQQDLARVFDKFFQASNSEQKSGTGLGLAICKRIVELHGGEISVRNSQEGGALFSFTLPMSIRNESGQCTDPLLASVV